MGDVYNMTNHTGEHLSGRPDWMVDHVFPHSVEKVVVSDAVAANQSTLHGDISQRSGWDVVAIGLLKPCHALLELLREFRTNNAALILKPQRMSLV